MPSASREHLPSLQQRVAWSTGLAALGGALSVAVLGGALAWTLSLRQEDRRLHESLTELAYVIAQTDGTTVSTRQALRNEQTETQATGIEMSVVRDGEVLGGRAVAGQSGCRTIARDVPRRQCGEWHGRDLLVADSSLASLQEWLWQSLGAMALVLLLVGVAALVSSRQAARVAIAPLEELRRAVARIDPQEPSVAVVETPIACAEVEQLRREFETLLVQLVDSLGHARRFAFHAAHEWRTPLATLRAEVDLLQEDTTNASIAVPVQRLSRYVDELHERLERVLVLATPASRVDGEPVSLEAIAQDIAASLGDAAAARISVAGDEGLVQGDESLLSLLFSNALENALKFSAGPVRVQVERVGERVVTTIEDDGQGVDPAEAEALFQPFFRGQRARSASVPGSGLGLAVAAHIVRMHQGRVGFDPVERGARLRIDLPAWVSRESRERVG